jgi:F-type H+-transporting ATPase subunit b
MPLPFVVAAPVVDIDGTFFVQGAIYVALVLVLHPLLFKPWLAAQARRTEAIDGALLKAKALRGDADTLSTEYDRRLADARDQAAELRSKVRLQEEAAQGETLAKARGRASEELEAARERLDREGASARQALGGKVDELADQITGKILGRAS